MAACSRATAWSTAWCASCAGASRSATCARSSSPALRRDRLHAGDLAPDDERLDTVGALEGEDGLHVGVVAGDVVLEQDAVGPEDVARVGDDRPGLRCVVHLGQ